METLTNAQRLLKPRRIANDFAPLLTFTSERTRTRRDHEKYLTLIDTIALLHQHQREPIKKKVAGQVVEMIPVTVEDIEAANRIAPEVLGRSLDELPPQTRRLLESIKVYVAKQCKAKQIDQDRFFFSRRDIREQTGSSETQVRAHLQRLEDLEYVARRHGRQGVGCLYELLIDYHESTGVAHVGLIDTGKAPQKMKLRRQLRGVERPLRGTSPKRLREVGSVEPEGFRRNFAPSPKRTSGTEAKN